MFKPVDAVPNFPQLEERIIAFWKKNKTFEKSIESRPASKTWTFLDGPPFITGLPHYGTLLASLPKDLFPRYWTMKGYRVRRVWGWDCHGLPAENKVEGKLTIKRKKDIEETVGVKRFIDECKRYVSQVSSEWQWYVDHIGRWVDFSNAYKTMDRPYMESVMWVFKQLYEKQLVYKGLRISLYCPHCVTPISNFEVAMDADNYQTIDEQTNVYKYQVLDHPNEFFLAWSTTPWNKLVTSALAVNPKLTYVRVQLGAEQYILVKDTLAVLGTRKYKILEKFSGAQLVGMKYKPHFDYYVIDKGKKAFEVIAGDFVTADEGTGIVTIAPYGEEDLIVMKKENVHIELLLDEEGMIVSKVPEFGGMYYLDANKAINAHLKKRNLLFVEQRLSHSIPTCWRCHTRLYYAPQNAWYVNVQILKKQMKQTNERINWVPAHFKYGRFLNSMEAAPDWCISRNRYWGSPVPVWECTCGERFVPGSIAELEQCSGKPIADLHKPEIDEVTVPCTKCGKIARRVTEVLDSWIEAGSASIAEYHYPFENKEDFKQFFPPDFIVEYTGQIRAWFYVVHVIANALFGTEGFKNVLVNGVILGTDGRKMSKNYGNYPDPKMLLAKYGGDALRLYLMSSPVMMGNDILISEVEYRNQIKDTLLLLWNSYKFFITYVNVHQWQQMESSTVQRRPKTILNRWIISQLHATIAGVTESLEKYDSATAIQCAKAFIADLSTWYIRRSRSQFARGDIESITTLYQVLTTISQMLAPIVPFISEEIYKNLTGEESVHLTSWPVSISALVDAGLENTIEDARSICEAGHARRKEKMIRVRQPLAQMTVTHASIDRYIHSPDRYAIEQLIREELNVKKVTWKKGKKEMVVELDTALTPELRAEGEARELIRKIQTLRKHQKFELNDRIHITVPSWPVDFESYILEKTVAVSIKRGHNVAISKA